MVKQGWLKNPVITTPSSDSRFCNTCGTVACPMGKSQLFSTFAAQDASVGGSAAIIAASLTVYVKRGSLDMYGDTGVPGGGASPQIGMAPGMIIDTLKVGEEIGMIDSNRPNLNLITFRSGQLRAAVAGIGASYSRSWWSSGSTTPCSPTTSSASS